MYRLCYSAGKPANRPTRLARGGALVRHPPVATRAHRCFAPVESPAARKPQKTSAFTLIELPAVRKRKAIAFTLIELLVVVAIISLLLSLILPALGRARTQAKVVVCAANQRSIGVGWHLYLAANKDVFPEYKGNMSWFYGGRHPTLWEQRNGVEYPRVLNPYVDMAIQNQRAAELFACPGDRPILNVATGEPAVTNGHNVYDYYGNCYFMNRLLLSLDDPETARVERDRFHVNNVKIDNSRMLVAGDVQWFYAIAEEPRYDARFHFDDDRANVLFLDGHVAFVEFFSDQAVTGEYSVLPYPPPPEEDTAFADEGS